MSWWVQTLAPLLTAVGLLAGCTAPLPQCQSPFALWGGPPANTSTRPCDGGACVRVVEIAASTETVCARGDDGGVWCWGGMLASSAEWVRPVRTTNVSAHRLVGLTAVGTIDTSEDAVFALQEGQPPGAIHLPGEAVPETGPAPVLRAAGGGQICDVDQSGSLTCRGMYCSHVDLNFNMFAKHDETEPLKTPFQPAALTAGTDFLCILSAEGAVACRGAGTGGELGSGQVSRCEPDFLPAAGLSSTVSQLAAGAHHACARLCDGSVRCWGTFTEDHAFPGGRTEETTGFGLSPRVIEGLRDVTQVAAGRDEACAVRTDGSLVCWSPTSDGVVKLREISGLTGVVEVAVGGGFRCVRTREGTVMCMGDGSGYAAVGAEPTPIEF